MMIFCQEHQIPPETFVCVADAFADVSDRKGAARSSTLKVLHIPSDREGYIQLCRSFDNIMLPNHREGIFSKQHTEYSPCCGKSCRDKKEDVTSYPSAHVCHTQSGKGVNLRYIQDMMRHSSSKTTEIYTHITQKDLDQIKSPMDDLDL